MDQFPPRSTSQHGHVPANCFEAKRLTVKEIQSGAWMAKSTGKSHDIGSSSLVANLNLFLRDLDAQGELPTTGLLGMKFMQQVQFSI